MKRILGISIILIYTIFMCSPDESTDHPHDAEGNAAHTHSHDDEGEAEHTHPHDDEGEAAHTHPHDDEGEAAHTHPHDDEGEAEHTHPHDDEGEAAHTHPHDDEGEAEHTHPHDDEGEAAHTHPHDDEGEAEHTHPHDDEGEAAAHNPLSDPAQNDQGMIQSDPEWERLIGLKTIELTRSSIEEVLTVPGEIIANHNEKAVVSPFIESSINCVFVNLGDRVKQGDELICLTSPELGLQRAEFNRARAELELKQKEYQRKENLFKEQIISERAFQEAELALNLARVNSEYAMKKLLALGLTPDDLESPPEGHSGAVGSTIHIYAPIDGVITVRNATVGQKVDLSTTLFEIVNLNTVWCEADIFEKDLKNVKLNQLVRLEVAAYPDVFSGRIFFIGSTLNPRTKTIKIMVEIRNSKGLLKPGMFANTHIITGEKNNVIVIPTEAVLVDENLNIVFIKESAGYHRHVVQLGIQSIDRVEVVSGLDAGESIVVQGHYQLKSRLHMSGVDSHAGHVH